MGVVDGPWLTAWLPELILWAVTFCALLLSFFLFFRQRARSLNASVRKNVVGICAYLHQEMVMDLYLTIFHGSVREQEVERTTTRNLSLGFKATFPWIGFVHDVAEIKAEVRRYVVRAEPITVIRQLMRRLEEKEAVAYADFTKYHITPNTALTEIVGEADKIRLSQLRGLIWVTGDFVRTNLPEPDQPDNAPGPEFVVSFGDNAQVRLLCSKTEKLRGDAGDLEGFHARCLANVNRWDPNTRSLSLSPIAIFR